MKKFLSFLSFILILLLCLAAAFINMIGYHTQAQKMKDQEDVAIMMQTNQLNYTRERSGYSLTSGGVGENR